MRTGILAKKIGMTSYFNDDGSRSPVTLLYIDNCEVINIMTKDKNKYSAVQIGIENTKVSKINKAQKSYFTKLKSNPKKHLKEFKVSDENIIKIGTEINAEYFKKGQFIDVTSISKGKGFAGSMKRHNFHGLRATHGVSVSHRSHGSTGQCQDPGRTFKGKKMAGHMGFRKITIHNLEIIEVNNEDGVLSIKGSVPGSKGSYVVIRDAIKPKSVTAKIKIHDESIEESKKMKKDSAESEEKKDTKDSKTGGEKK